MKTPQKSKGFLSKKFVQFGAGNIGRSFTGRLFSSSGYETVFIDVNETVVDLINREKKYRVCIRENNVPDRFLTVAHVRAVSGRNIEKTAAEIADASYVCTSVGKKALGFLAPVIAKGLTERHTRFGEMPLDIILAENAHGADEFLREAVRKELPADFPLDQMLGLVETAVGKMVPVIPPPADEPLLLYAEPFDTLIVDKDGFKNIPSDVQGLALKSSMKAWVDRKMYIHNLGHTALAYIAARENAGYDYVWQAVSDPCIRQEAVEAINEAIAGLRAEWKGVFTADDLEGHRDDLLARFENHALGDTLFRVGRDTGRKLHKTDRILGAVLMCRKHALPCPTLIRAYLDAPDFLSVHALQLDEADRTIARDIQSLGIGYFISKVSGLNSDVPGENALLADLYSEAGKHAEKCHAKKRSAAFFSEAPDILQKKTGCPAQLSQTLPAVLTDGPSHNTKMVFLHNGSGLEVDVSPDLGMSIIGARYCGIPLTWQSGVGITNPAYLDLHGLNWLRIFPGGLLTTCGLSYLGAPCNDNGTELGLHGPVLGLSARNVRCESEPGSSGSVSVSGTVREWSLAEPNLALTRKISMPHGTPVLIIEDTVTNDSFQPSPLMLLAHINLGYPLVDRGIRLTLPNGTRTTARDPLSAQGIGEWNSFSEPVKDCPERVFYHSFAEISGDTAEIMLSNHRITGPFGKGLSLRVRVNKNEYPYLVQWKKPGDSR